MTRAGEEVVRAELQVREDTVRLDKSIKRLRMATLFRDNPNAEALDKLKDIAASSGILLSYDAGVSVKTIKPIYDSPDVCIALIGDPPGMSMLDSHKRIIYRFEAHRSPDGWEYFC